MHWFVKFALVAVAATLVSCLLAIWLKLEQRSDLLKLTQMFLSWQVIAGALTAAGGKELRGWLASLGKRDPNASN